MLFVVKRDLLLHQSKSHRSSKNFSVDSVLLLIIQHEELMKWLPSRVTRTRIRVIGLNYSEILTQKKGNLVRVSEELELSELELTE